MLKKSRQVLEKEAIEYKAAMSEALKPQKMPVANKHKKGRMAGNQMEKTNE